MVMSILNARAVQPFVAVTNLAVKVNDKNLRPAGPSITKAMTGETTLDTGFALLSINLVSVYVDGFRMINFTHDFGKTYSAFTISGTTITFKAPVTGQVVVMLDLPFSQVIPPVNILPVTNIQGARTANKSPNAAIAGTYCEPLILTQPQFGNACLSDDRMSIVYLPNQNYEGFDAFSFTVISDRGQVADPKCAYVKVGNAKEVKK